MNLGRNILELRKKKNVTQEELAAELGVTAAAVSKWENGYTLPDILMLCALADYFQVATDELLGRNPKTMYAVIATHSQDLGQEIKSLIKRYGFTTKQICGSYAEAVEVARTDANITHLFASFEYPMKEDEKDGAPDGLYSIESHATSAQKILDGFEIYLRNMPNYDGIMLKKTVNP